MEKFHEVAESQQKKEENKDASATAGLLEKLSVDDKKGKAEEEVSVVTKEDKDAKSDAVKADEEKKDAEKDTEKKDEEKKDEEPVSST